MLHSHLNDMEIPETKRFIPKGFELGTTFSQPNRSVKVARYRFLSEYLSRLSVNHVAINKDLKKLTPQLYYIKMKICYDQGCNDIVVVVATK